MEPKLTETAICSRANSTSFERGYSYFEGDAVSKLIRRGGRLTAEVEGSDYDPYEVSITLNQHGIASAYCTCPYDWGGDCKHIVATLLTCLHAPEEITERPSLEESLRELDRDQLEALLLGLAESSPGLVDAIQDELDKAPSQGNAEAQPRVRRTTVDPQSIRRQVTSAIHGLDSMRRSEAYWHVGSVVSEVIRITEQARAYLDAGDVPNALVVLEAVTDEYSSAWEHLDDSNGEVGDLYRTLVPLWTEAMLSIDLTPSEREDWAERFNEWQEELSDYGLDDMLNAPQAAALSGWEEDSYGDEENEDEVWEGGGSWVADELAAARLNVLKRQGQTEEYLEYARDIGKLDLYVTMLVELGQPNEAVDYARQHVHSIDAIEKLVKVLAEHNETERALDIAAHGLLLEGNHASLADWVRDTASSLGRDDAALHAALTGLRESPTLERYDAARELAGLQWSELSEGLMDHLRADTVGARFVSSDRIGIFVREGLIDDAIDGLGEYAHYSDVKMIAEVAYESHPEWTGRACKRQAENIMDRGQSQLYRQAVDWLKLASKAYHASGRQAEWDDYLALLLAQHGRKYKLMPMLRELR